MTERVMYICGKPTKNYQVTKDVKQGDTFVKVTTRVCKDCFKKESK